MQMHFETYWFYMKNYQSKKKKLQNIRTAALSFFFFKFNPFQVNVPRKLRDFCVLRAQIETSQFILQTKSGGWFLYGLH